MAGMSSVLAALLFAGSAALLSAGCQPITVGEMVFIPAGSFEMGDSFGVGEVDELPVHTVTLSAYEIGKFEVTNKEVVDVYNWALDQDRFATVDSSTARAFGAVLLDLGDPDQQIAWDGSAFTVGERDGLSMAEHPVIEISWYGAATYCNWLSEIQGRSPVYNTITWLADSGADGYRLPTEAEWERAAGWDPVEERHYAYGNGSDSNDCDAVNHRPTYDYCNPLGLSEGPYTAPVGWYNGANDTVDSPSPAGLYDMSGNVWEWCHDRYDYNYYSNSPTVDPQGAATGTARVLRGGSWVVIDYFARAALRFRDDPANTNYDFGFRLARSVAPD